MTAISTKVRALDLARWTVEDVAHVQWVAMRFLAAKTGSTDTIQRRLHWADHMVPFLQCPITAGVGFGDIPGVGPALALGSLIANCQRHPEDIDWCRWVMDEAGIDVPALLTTLEPVAELYDNPQHVPVQVFQPRPGNYALVPLTELPHGHSMHSCGHKDFFQRELARIQRRGRLAALFGRRREESAERTRAGRALTSAVLDGDVAPCPRHDPTINWEAVNAAAEHIQRTVRPWNRDNVIAAAHTAPGLTTEERKRLSNLFIDPIRWDRGEGEVVGGQHRLCGYRVAHATHAFVATGPTRTPTQG